jgi:hypothetical protein
MSGLPNDIIDVQLCPVTIVADQVRQHDRAQPPPARGAGIATPPDSPAGAQMPFFEFFDDGGRTDV